MAAERRAQLVAHQPQELRPLPLEVLQRRKVLHGDHHRDDLAPGVADRGCVEEHADAAPVGDRELDLFGVHDLGVDQLLREGDLVQAKFAAVGTPHIQDLQQLFHRLARRAHAFRDPPRLAVVRFQAA